MSADSSSGLLLLRKTKLELWRGMEVRTNLSIHFCGDESSSKVFNGSLGVSPLKDCGRSCVALKEEIIWSVPVLASNLGFHPWILTCRKL